MAITAASRLTAVSAAPLPSGGWRRRAGTRPGDRRVGGREAPPRRCRRSSDRRRRPAPNRGVPSGRWSWPATSRTSAGRTIARHGRRPGRERGRGRGRVEAGVGHDRGRRQGERQDVASGHDRDRMTAAAAVLLAANPTARPPTRSPRAARRARRPVSHRLWQPVWSAGAGHDRYGTDHVTSAPTATMTTVVPTKSEMGAMMMIGTRLTETRLNSTRTRPRTSSGSSPGAWSGRGSATTACLPGQVAIATTTASNETRAERSNGDAWPAGATG